MTDSLALFAALLVEIVLTSIVLTWIYNNTNGSMLAAMLFPTTMNWAMWVMLPGVKTDGAVVSLTVAALTIVVIAVVLVSGAARLRREQCGTSGRGE